jgi:hypothetical protein
MIDGDRSPCRTGRRLILDFQTVWIKRGVRDFPSRRYLSRRSSDRSEFELRLFGINLDVQFGAKLFDRRHAPLWIDRSGSEPKVTIAGGTKSKVLGRRDLPPIKVPRFPGVLRDEQLDFSGRSAREIDRERNVERRLTRDPRFQRGHGWLGTNGISAERQRNHGTAR